MKVGAIIRKWRLANDDSVRKVAAEIGIAPSTLVHIEQGRMPPHSETLITLWNWLITQEPEETKPPDVPTKSPDVPTK